MSYAAGNLKVIQGGARYTAHEINARNLRARMWYAASRDARLGQFDLSSLLQSSAAATDPTTSAIASGAGLAADAIVPGSGGVVSGLVSSFADIFGGNPATGKNAERQANMYTLYEEAQTSPGSPASIDAVVQLYTISRNLYDPIDKVQQNEPQVTRTYAQQVLQVLATQGWTNVNSLHPVYTGSLAVGEVFSPNAATGTESVTAVRPTPGSIAGIGGELAALLTPENLIVGAVVFGLAMLIFGRRESPRVVYAAAPAAPNPPRRRSRMPLPTLNPPHRRRAA